VVTVAIAAVAMVVADVAKASHIKLQFHLRFEMTNRGSL
jgi:hypothetical protein